MGLVFDIRVGPCMDPELDPDYLMDPKIGSRLGSNSLLGPQLGSNPVISWNRRYRLIRYESWVSLCSPY